MAAAGKDSGLHFHFTDAASYMRSVLAQEEVCTWQLVHVMITSGCGRFPASGQPAQRSTFVREGTCKAAHEGRCMQDDRPARPGAIFLDCYDSRGRIPEELTQPPFLSTCLQVRSAWPFCCRRRLDGSLNPFSRAWAGMDLRIASDLCYRVWHRRWRAAECLL